MRLFRDKHFERLGLSVDLLGPVVNMEDVGYSNKTQSIDVISGVYVYIKHKQCLILMRPNVCLYHYGGHAFAKIVKSEDVCVSGRWVAFENPGFSGEPYILEKGLYETPEDWGALSFKLSSIQPILHVRKLLPDTFFHPH